MTRLPRKLRILLLSLALGGGLLVPAGREVRGATDGRDYASFHYAVRLWADGGDPYDGAALTQRAREDGRRGRVYPFFYPPPALPMLAWTLPVSLRMGHGIMAMVNLASLIGLGLLLARWLRMPMWLPVLLLATSSGAIETARLGQVNGVIALLVGLAASRSRGVPVAVAALLKMSPAVLLLRFLAARSWRPLLAGLGVGLGALVLSVGIAGVECSMRFFRDVLPGLSDGGWNGLGIPLDFRANHSLAGMLNAAFPGPDDVTLSQTARRFGIGLTASGFLALAWLGRRRFDPLGEALLWGALSALVVITPVYAWEHHHVLLLLPMVATGQALREGRLPRWCWSLFLRCWVIWAWRLPWWRAAWRSWPALRPLVEESKLLLPLILLGLGSWGAARSPGDRDGPGVRSA
ncbi:MAG: glycosyltransferase family 87 protein [Myxococcota bacterium]|nr:glycosyltransferase family 87 protein [Myxococcota bacterium]